MVAETLQSRPWEEEEVGSGVQGQPPLVAVQGQLKLSENPSQRATKEVSVYCESLLSWQKIISVL